MNIGVTVRNMGAQSTPGLVKNCALAAEDLGFESVWITDHIAIPPDDAEGSGGRYLDTLTTLAWIGGFTERIMLGSGVLILPYRAALATAKQIATVQELSSNRLLLGVGIGWMDAEFRAVGVDRHSRGRISDETLAFFNDCFANDEVEANGQAILFKPRPPKPSILVGGRPPHAIERAARLADGWLPMARSPDDLERPIAQYRDLTRSLERPDGNVTVMTGLPTHDPVEASDLYERYADLGVDRLVCGVRYDTVAEYRNQLEALARFCGG